MAREDLQFLSCKRLLQARILHHVHKLSARNNDQVSDLRKVDDVESALRKCGMHPQSALCGNDSVLGLPLTLLSGEMQDAVANWPLLY